MGNVLCDFCDQETDLTYNEKFESMLNGCDDSDLSAHLIKKWTQFADCQMGEQILAASIKDFQRQARGLDKEDGPQIVYFDNQSGSTACFNNDDQSQSLKTTSNLALTIKTDKESFITRVKQQLQDQKGDTLPRQQNTTFTIMETSVDQIDENSFVYLQTRYGNEKIPIKCFKDVDLSNIQLNITSGCLNDTSVVGIKDEVDDNNQLTNLCPQEVELLIQQKYAELEALKKVQLIHQSQKQQQQVDATVYDYNLSQLQELNNVEETYEQKKVDFGEFYPVQSQAYNLKEQAIMPVDVVEMNQEIDAAQECQETMQIQLESDQQDYAYVAPKRKRFQSFIQEQLENEDLLTEL